MPSQPTPCSRSCTRSSGVTLSPSLRAATTRGSARSWTPCSRGSRGPARRRARCGATPGSPRRRPTSRSGWRPSRGGGLRGPRTRGRRGGSAAAPGGSLGSSGASEGGEAPGPGPRGAAPASLSEQALTPRERMLARKAEAARLRQMELQVAGREQARSRLAPAAGRGAGGAAASGTSCDGIIGTQSDFVRVKQPAAARSPKETAKSDPSPDRSELLRPGGAGAAGLNQTFRGRGHQAGGGASGPRPPAPGRGRGGEGGAVGRPAADGGAVWSPKRPRPPGKRASSTRATSRTTPTRRTEECLPRSWTSRSRAGPPRGPPR